MFCAQTTVFLQTCYMRTTMHTRRDEKHSRNCTAAVDIINQGANNMKPQVRQLARARLHGTMHLAQCLTAWSLPKRYVAAAHASVQQGYNQHWSLGCDRGKKILCTHAHVLTPTARPEPGKRLPCQAMPTLHKSHSTAATVV